MEIYESKKFVCKYCNKGYPCMESLGAHLRSHKIDNEENAKPAAELYEKLNEGIIGPSSEVDVQSQSAYVLREKPKKTCKFSHDSSSSKQVKICKECGKAFKSVKALCGHMACHSEKDKQKDLLMDIETDTESSGLPRRQRRSKRLRCRTPDVNSSSFSVENDGSSSASETLLDQEEVAWCLLMLSKDMGNSGGANSNADSADNNSAKTSSGYAPSRKNFLNYASNISELAGGKKLRDRKLLSSEIDLSDDSDFEYFGKVESDYGDYENNRPGRPKAKYGSDLQDFRAQSITTPTKLRTIGSSPTKKINEDEYEQAYIATPQKYGSRKEAAGDFRRRKGMTSICKIQNAGTSNAKVSMNKSNDHTAGTSFCPGKTSDSKLMESYRSTRTANERKLSNEGAKKPSKRSKGHKCPFCFKIFKSGQALGGHKRIHFAGNTGDRTLVINQETPSLLDLNLPPPDEVES